MQSTKVTWYFLKISFAFAVTVQTMATRKEVDLLTRKKKFQVNR